MTVVNRPQITLEQVDACLGHDDNVGRLWLGEIADQDATATAHLINEDGVSETVVDSWGRDVSVRRLREILSS